MPEPARRALLVATSQYLDPSLPNLTGAVNDAAELAQVLADDEVGGFDVQTVLDRPAHEVTAAIEEFLQACNHRDLVLLYFTGHGIKGMDGALYFAAANTRAKLLKASGVAASWVNEALDACRSKRQMVLLDCCHSGAFARGIKAGGHVGSTEQLSGHGQAVGRGRVILTASDAIQFALERPDEGELVKSVFTTCVVRGLRTGEADVDGDGRITLEDLFEYVKDAVHRENPHQTPEMSAVALQGEFMIARNPHARGRLPAGLSAAVLSPAVHIREQAVAQLRDLLGVADDLELRQAVLQALALLLADDSRRVSAAAGKALEDTDEFATQLRPPSPPLPVREPLSPPQREPLPPPEPVVPPQPAPAAAPPAQERTPAPPPKDPTPVLPPSRGPSAPPDTPPRTRRAARSRLPLAAITALIAAAAAAFVFGLVNRQPEDPGADTTQQTPAPAVEEQDVVPPAPAPPVEEPQDEPAPPAPPFAVGDLRWADTAPGDVTERARVRGIIRHNDRFIAVGTRDGGSDFDAFVLTSDDGAQWQRQHTDALQATRAQQMRALAVGGDRLIAVGSEGVRPDMDAAVWLFSDDEVRQVDATEGLTEDHREMFSVEWTGDRFIAVGCVDDPSDTVCEATTDGSPRTGVWTSSDGRQWQEVPADQIEEAASATMRDILTISDELLVAVGYQQTGDDSSRIPALWTSTDGGQNWEWIDLPQPPDTSGGALLEAVRQDDGILVGGYVRAQGWEPAVWSSADGRRWDVRLIEGIRQGNQVLEGLSAAGSGFVAVGRSFEDGAHRGAVWASGDGRAWSRQQADDFPLDETAFRAVAASENRVVVGGGTEVDELGELRMWTGTPAD